MVEHRAGQLDERVLVLAPTARDAATSRGVLEAAGVHCLVCDSILEVCRQATLGAGAAVVTAEALLGDREGYLTTWLDAQPPWSDFPLVVLTPPGPESAGLLMALGRVGHMTLMKRPVQVSTLLSTVQSALRDRRRQYAVRDLLADRLRAEETLREERERYRVTLSSIGDAVIATDTEGRVTLMNGVAETLTGWPQFEAVGQPLTDVLRIVHEQTRRPVENPALRALEEGVIVGLANHTVLLARDGTERPIDDSAAPMRDREGKVLGAVLVFRDVTERKRAEAERARQAESLRLALAAADLGTWEWDPTTDQITLSDRAAEIYSLPPGRTYSREWMRGLLLPDHRAMARDAAARAVAERSEYDLEYPLDRMGGKLTWVAVRGRGVYDDAGKLVRMLGVAQDVTSRKEAEQALRESEARYRAIVEATPECVKLVAPDGTLLQMNRAGLAMVEADEAALGSCVYNVVAPEFRDAFRAFNEMVCRGEGGSLEFDIIGLEGTRRHMETNAVPLPTQPGGFIQLAVTRDVSERRRADAEAETERRRLEEVFRLAPSFMAVLRGPDHVFERANDRYVELVGGREVIGKTVREALPEIEDQEFFEILDHVYQTGEPYTGMDVRVLLRGRGGPLEERILEFVYQPLRDADGTVSGALVQGIDLTERHRAQAEVGRLAAESERQRRVYETALSNTADFNYVFDLRGRFVYVNAALLSLWGKSLDEVVGKDYFELGYPPQLAGRLQGQIRQVIETKRPLRDETPYTSNMEVRDYEYIFVPVFGSGGAVEAVAGSTRDITDRKRMEDELRDTDRKKDDFIALLAHELRNPLAPIRNGLQVLRLANDRQARAEAQAMMERQLTHMVRLIDDLLDVSRISRNKMELRRTRLTLADVVSSAVETARPAIEEAGHELTVSLPGVPVYLHADLTRLAQVFSNLLTNSAKYTERRGRIWLDAERREGDVVVKVRDNGIGIPVESLENIFDMFSQVDRSLERSTGGLGIGLALVKGLVEMHGGTVKATSEGEGQGSTFIVTLPVMASQVRREAGMAEGEGARRHGRRILVVDDNRDGATSMAMMLGLQGNEVLTAHDGFQAIQAAERFRPEVILMDVGMPNLNGLDATRRIREQPWGKGIKIFALTGWGQENDRERSREAGCDGHLVKPVNLSDLEKVLGGQPGKEHG